MLVEAAFEPSVFTWQAHVVITAAIRYLPRSSCQLSGASKPKSKLGWVPKTTFGWLLALRQTESGSQVLDARTLPSTELTISRAASGGSNDPSVT